MREHARYFHIDSLSVQISFETTEDSLVIVEYLTLVITAINF